MNDHPRQSTVYFVVLLLAFGARLQADVDDDALVTHLTFDEQEGRTVGDLAPQGYTKDKGCLEGLATWLPGGVFGGAIQFPGQNGSYLPLDRSGDIQALAGPFPRSHKLTTFATWFRCDDANRQRAVQTIFETGGYHNNVNMFIYEGVLYVGLCSGYPFKPTPGKPPSLQKPQWMNSRDHLPEGMTLDLSHGQWHHIALTVRGNDMPNKDGFKLYIDGRFVTSRPGVQIHEHGAAAALGAVNDEAIYPSARHGETPLPANPRAPDLSRYRDDPGQAQGIHPFAGAIDDFRVYRRVLSEDEIAALYHLGQESLRTRRNEARTDGEPRPKILFRISDDMNTDLD